MPPKRKSTGVTPTTEATGTPSKKSRNSTQVPGSNEGASELGTPKTGEKRKRGRPRKNPEAPTPQPADGPKRGRGRPRKVVSEADVAAAAGAASEGPKRGRGRPRKEPASETPVKTPKKDGRGRPRKSLPAEPVEAPSTTPKRGRGRPPKSMSEGTAVAPLATPKKDGRGRPRKSLPAETSEAPSETPQRGPGRPRKSLPAETTKPSSETPKRGRGRPRKSLPAKTSEDPSTTLKRGRGRPRKSLATEQSTDVVEPKAEPATSSDSKVDTGRSYWLMKAEPESRLEKGVDVKFSIDDLAAAKEPEPWDGVRNPVARNLMRDMKKGDQAFFYHSNCKVPGVVGVMEIVQEHSVDESAFDPKHPYYDPKASRDNPKWVVVHVEFRRKLKKQVTLVDLKAHAQPGKPLENLQTLKQSRLSVSSVTPAQWKFILELAGEDS